MTNFQVTSTGIAVALAIVVALGMLFLGNPAEPAPAASLPVATTTTMITSDPLPQGPLPTELTGSDTVIGTGAEAVAGSRVTVNYVGMLPDGTIFDASERHGQAFTFTLGAGEVIQGWDQGVAGMKVGGQRRLIVPPAFGYGAQEIPGVIPANSTLIFDVELVGVE
jgi:FKBP-type peptidyl-prolyl cis-trans isomerase